MTDPYIYGITALLPLAASMLILQTNPYHALVIRGILGAVAALVYTVLGAADVALTEALVGTLLAVSLYAVAVRSSLVFRLGVLTDDLSAAQNKTDLIQASHVQEMIKGLQAAFSKHHMRVELLPYLDTEDLQEALINKQVHAIWMPANLKAQGLAPQQPKAYAMTIRLHRLYEIMKMELALPKTDLIYANPETETRLSTAETAG